jgi:hypothetical protein
MEEKRMTEKDIQKRNERSQALKVLRANGNYFVESSEGMVLYKVTPDGNGKFSCSCGDYAKGAKNNFLFQCKHICSVLNCVPNGEVEEGQFLEKKKPKLDERFITEIEGREFVKYAGLLDLAHQKGLIKIEVEPLQFPTKDNGNFAICKAVVLSRSGETYSDIGDANLINCNSKVSKHLLRMASTRAIGRALRSFTNIGNTMLEELGDLDEVIGEEASGKDKPKKTFPQKTAKPPEPKTAGESKPPEPASPGEAKVDKGNGSNGGKGAAAKAKTEEPKPKSPKAEPKPDQPAPQMSSAQKSAIFNLSRRRGITVDELEKMSQQNYGVPLENLSSSNASAFIRTLQQSA